MICREFGALTQTEDCKLIHLPGLSIFRKPQALTFPTTLVLHTQERQPKSSPSLLPLWVPIVARLGSQSVLGTEGSINPGTASYYTANASRSQVLWSHWRSCGAMTTARAREQVRRVRSGFSKTLIYVLEKHRVHKCS